MALTTAIFNLIALTAIGYALWVRRITWTCRWEIAVTLGITLDGVGLFLTTPAGQGTVGRALRTVTGQTYLATTLGHLCIVASAAALSYSLLSRLSTDDGLHRSFTRWVKRPTVTAALVLLAVFSLGNLGSSGLERLETVWTHFYWIVLAVTLTYLFGYAGIALWHLRRYPRHRVVANLYLVACGSGLIATTARLAWLLPAESTDSASMIAVMFGSLWLTGFAVGAAVSWKRKTSEFKTLRAVVAA
jgi:hypothetical protein